MLGFFLRFAWAGSHLSGMSDNVAWAGSFVAVFSERIWNIDLATTNTSNFTNPLTLQVWCADWVGVCLPNCFWAFLSDVHRFHRRSRGELFLAERRSVRAIFRHSMLDLDLLCPDLCLLDPASRRGLHIDFDINFCKDLECVLHNLSRRSWLVLSRALLRLPRIASPPSPRPGKSLNSIHDLGCRKTHPPLPASLWCGHSPCCLRT